MFTKILSIAREKFRKIYSHQDLLDDEDIIDDPIVEFVVQIDAKGDFAIGANCLSTDEEHAPFLGMTLYLLNSGMLSDYFVEALRLDSEGDEAKLKFVRNAMGCWKEIYEKEGAEGIPQAQEHKDAVDPKDVFSFHKMRP
jgi:hypothetical protein